MEEIAYRLRDGYTRFAAEGHGVIVELGDVFATADAELHKLLDSQPALERTDAPAKGDSA